MMQKNRLLSLDVLRGITILLMVIVNNPGNWDTVYPALLHAEWNGCKLPDLVFPFFIFILGMAIPLAIPDKKNTAALFEKILVRSLRIICLGLFLNFFNKIAVWNLTGISLLIARLIITILIGYALMGNYNERMKCYVVVFIFAGFMVLAFGTVTYQEARIPGVLQRIGFVYFFASLYYLLASIRIQFTVVILLLLGYWLALIFIPIPGIEKPNFEVGTNLSAWIDQIILRDHVYVGTKPWDPEGILSTFPAVAQGMIGSLIVQSILTSNKKETLKWLVETGIFMLLFGFAWSLFFPLNKSIWTSSFALYTSGIAALCFAVLYYLIDFKNHTKRINPLLIWGINPMIVFFLSGIIPRALAMITLTNQGVNGETINLQNYIYQFGIAPFFSNPMCASFAYSIVFIGFLHLILFVLYKRKWIIKV